MERAAGPRPRRASVRRIAVLLARAASSAPRSRLRPYSSFVRRRKAPSVDHPRRPSARSCRAIGSSRGGARSWPSRPTADDRVLGEPRRQADVPSAHTRRHSAEPIAGTEKGFAPFFSPDGQWIGFFTVDELTKVLLAADRRLSLEGATDHLRRRLGGGRPHRSRSDVQRRARHRPRDRRRVVSPDALDSSRGNTRISTPSLSRRARSSLHGAAGEGFRRHAASNIAVLDSAKGTSKTVLEGASFARYAAGKLIFVRGDSVFSTASTSPPGGDGDSRRDHRQRCRGSARDPELSKPFLPERSPSSKGLRIPRRIGRRSSLWTGTERRARFRCRRPSTGWPCSPRTACARRDSLGTNAGTIAIYERDRRILSTLTPEPGSHLCPSGPRRPPCRVHPVRETYPSLSVKNGVGSGEIEALTDPSGDA